MPSNGPLLRRSARRLGGVSLPTTDSSSSAASPSSSASSSSNALSTPRKRPRDTLPSLPPNPNPPSAQHTPRALRAEKRRRVISSSSLSAHSAYPSPEPHSSLALGLSLHHALAGFGLGLPLSPLVGGPGPIPARKQSQFVRSPLSSPPRELGPLECASSSSSPGRVKTRKGRKKENAIVGGAAVPTSPTSPSPVRRSPRTTLNTAIPTTSSPTAKSPLRKTASKSSAEPRMTPQKRKRTPARSRAAAPALPPPSPSPAATPIPTQSRRTSPRRSAATTTTVRKEKAEENLGRKPSFSVHIDRAADDEVMDVDAIVSEHTDTEAPEEPEAPAVDDAEPIVVDSESTDVDAGADAPSPSSPAAPPPTPPPPAPVAEPSSTQESPGIAIPSLPSPASPAMDVDANPSIDLQSNGFITSEAAYTPTQAQAEPQHDQPPPQSQQPLYQQQQHSQQAYQQVYQQPQVQSYYQQLYPVHAHRRMRWSNRMWANACQTRVETLLNRYSHRTIRNFVAQEAEDYFLTHGYPRPWRVYLPGLDSTNVHSASGDAPDTNASRTKAGTDGMEPEERMDADDGEETSSGEDWSDYESSLNSDSDGWDEWSDDEGQETVRKEGAGFQLHAVASSSTSGSASSVSSEPQPSPTLPDAPHPRKRQRRLLTDSHSHSHSPRHHHHRHPRGEDTDMDGEDADADMDADAEGDLDPEAYAHDPNFNAELSSALCSPMSSGRKRRLADRGQGGRELAFYVPPPVPGAFGRCDVDVDVDVVMQDSEERGARGRDIPPHLPSPLEEEAPVDVEASNGNLVAPQPLPPTLPPSSLVTGEELPLRPGTPTPPSSASTSASVPSTSPARPPTPTPLPAPASSPVLLPAFPAPTLSSQVQVQAPIRPSTPTPTPTPPPTPSHFASPPAYPHTYPYTYAYDTAPILPVPPPRLASIPVHTLKNNEIGAVGLTGRGTPIDRGRGAQWALGVACSARGGTGFGGGRSSGNAAGAGFGREGEGRGRALGRDRERDGGRERGLRVGGKGTERRPGMGRPGEYRPQPLLVPQQPASAARGNGNGTPNNSPTMPTNAPSAMGDPGESDQVVWDTFFESFRREPQGGGGGGGGGMEMDVDGHDLRSHLGAGAIASSSHPQTLSPDLVPLSSSSAPPPLDLLGGMSTNMGLGPGNVGLSPISSPTPSSPASPSLPSLPNNLFGAGDDQLNLGNLGMNMGMGMGLGLGMNMNMNMNMEMGMGMFNMGLGVGVGIGVAVGVGVGAAGVGSGWMAPPSSPVSPPLSPVFGAEREGAGAGAGTMGSAMGMSMGGMEFETSPTSTLSFALG
ncbi:hypothetical protein DXG03_002950 [Asterophora parasitica]|uniref:Uncharacterized protein n=1 Tax=Asterophora parasitica TaxID=117018 RepID=A0A9P7KAY9_9AGAR|nr:hypothetical protein DXG03_002950 [Asterophora parasitica]